MALGTALAETLSAFAACREDLLASCNYVWVDRVVMAALRGCNKHADMSRWCCSVTRAAQR